MLHHALALLALAAEPDADDAARREDRRDTRYYAFDKDDVGGHVDRPTNVQVIQRARRYFASILTVRSSFTWELVRIAKDV